MACIGRSSNRGYSLDRHRQPPVHERSSKGRALNEKVIKEIQRQYNPKPNEVNKNSSNTKVDNSNTKTVQTKGTDVKLNEANKNSNVEKTGNNILKDTLNKISQKVEKAVGSAANLSDAIKSSIDLAADKMRQTAYDMVRRPEPIGWSVCEKANKLTALGNDIKVVNEAINGKALPAVGFAIDFKNMVTGSNSYTKTMSEINVCASVTPIGGLVSGASLILDGILPNKSKEKISNVLDKMEQNSVNYESKINPYKGKPENNKLITIEQQNTSPRRYRGRDDR